jgi:hypothetical protein
MIGSRRPDGVACTMTTAFLLPDAAGRHDVAVAALYFDRVVVLDPTDEEEPFFLQSFGEHVPWLEGQEPEFRRLWQDLSELGIVRKVELDRETKDMAAKPLVEALDQCGEELRKQFGFPHKPDPGYTDPRRGESFGMSNHWRSRSLTAALHQYDLAFSKTNRYMGLSSTRTLEPIARLYLSSLIETLAIGQGASPMGSRLFGTPGASTWTPDVISDSLLSGVRNRHSISDDMIPGLLGTLAIERVLPVDAGALDAEMIVFIRTKHRAELTKFQDYLSTFGVAGSHLNISPSQDPESIREALAVEYERSIFPALMEIQETMRSLRIEAIWNAISVKAALPAGLAGTLGNVATGSPIFSGAIAGVGLALGFGKTYFDHRNKVLSLSNSPHHYLVALRRETASGLAARFTSQKLPSSLFK